MYKSPICLEPVLLPIRTSQISKNINFGYIKQNNFINQEIINYTKNTYINDIWMYLIDKNTLLRNQPKITNLNNQKQITEKMRGILVDWIIEVHRKFKMTPYTLYLAINLVDRTCESEEIAKKNYQL